MGAKGLHIDESDLQTMMDAFTVALESLTDMRREYPTSPAGQMYDEIGALSNKVAEYGRSIGFKRKHGRHRRNPLDEDIGINPQHRRQWLPSMVDDDDPPSHNWPRSEVQSLLFSVDHFTEASARAWAQKHGFRYGKVDTTEHYHRLRQFEPTGAPCRTMELPGTHPVVKAVVCRGQ